ncbi:DUF1737 domain-containing protein [Croceicoccus mobilis]|uniref:DUF1737 domain-containing protein n=1 Tax=Croceicoccus mobilis TaxID=1703339 RepID=A0A917DX88_9SPHN|nr:DUF1737 domain-containing protein [Croceicoccus mobilis]GGD78796.1 hypothetical protein GCM10010990_30840 [Croceicoccus mobilis]
MDKANPPEGRLPYRCLTGPDDHAFCERVSKALEEGWKLHGSPSLTHDGRQVIVAQAVIWPGWSD